MNELVDALTPTAYRTVAVALAAVAVVALLLDRGGMWAFLAASAVAATLSVHKSRAVSSAPEPAAADA